MTFESILHEIDNHVLTITLNRPEKKNMMDRLMTQELVGAIRDADDNDDVRAIIITGAGSSYCSGADLSSGDNVFDPPGGANEADTEMTELAKIRNSGGEFIMDIFNAKKPLIAAINGDCIGIGATISLPFDIRICTPDARFGFMFARRGIVQEAASSWFLPRLVGMGPALEWCMRGNLVSAEEAEKTGLVKAIYPPDQLLAEAQIIARDIADKCSPVSVALARQMLWRLHSTPHPMDALRIESRGVYFRAQQNDVMEGISSFVERRLPNFPDKVSSDMPSFFPWWEDPEFT